MIKKQFVLDTNVLLHDPDSLFAFADNDVVIILSVIEELDTFKKAQGELGYNAREVIRSLDALRKKGNLQDGVKLESGGTIKSIQDENALATTSKVDNIILLVAQKLLKKNKNTIVVSKDCALRVKADAMKIPVEDYHNDKIHEEFKYAGHCKLTVHPLVLDDVFNKNEYEFDPNEKCDFLVNEYILMVNEQNPKNSALVRYVGNKKVVRVNNKINVANIRPRNVEQAFAIDAILNKDCKLSTIQGLAGSGKSLITVSAAIQSALIDKEYETIYISKPILPMGGKQNDIGFLPGDLNDKLLPHYQSYMDAIKFIKTNDAKSKKTCLSQEVDKIIEFLPLTFLRGRSLHNCIVILDEAQNASPSEIKTLITRAGENCKIILLADLDQIDNPFLDKWSNGFLYTVEKFKGQPIYSHIELTQCERSQLADVASKIL